MPFSIDEFKARNPAGFTRDSFFLLQFVAPQFYGNGGDANFVSYLCSTASLPGVALLSQEQTRWGYGPPKKVPFGMVHSDINTVIYSDGEGLAIDLFDQWQRNIVSFGYEHTAVQNGLMGEVQYPDHYETDLNILYFSENGDEQELISYMILGAYPLGMGEIPVSWENRAGIARLTIPFTYRTYQITKHAIGDDGSINIDPSYVDGITGGPGGVFVSANLQRLSALFNAQALSGGFINMGGTNVSFSSALQLISDPLSSIGSKLQVVGGINANIRTAIGNIGASLSI